MSEKRILERSGYGASFNKIHISGNILEKIPYTPYGLTKLLKEKNAYEVFSKEAPLFPMAQFIGASSNSISLLYYERHVPLWSIYKDMDDEQKRETLRSIFASLEILHATKKIELTKKEYNKLFLSEAIEKVKSRYKEVEDLVNKYTFTHVNGLECLSFEEALDKVEQKLEAYLHTKNRYELSYIHGDPQFSNILYNINTKKLIFIDPRGYFGNSDLFGVEEYDTAKVLFALSGYDIFDNMSFPEIRIEEGNIILPTFAVDERYKTLCPELLFLLVSIWLANCHTFKDIPNKAIVSHAYARYLASQLL